MRYVFISDLSGLGGGEVGIVYLTEELSKSGSCLVICRHQGPLVRTLEDKGIKTAIVDFKNKSRLPSSLVALRNEIANFRADAVLSNDPTTSLLAHLGLVGSGIPTFWISHGQWYQFDAIMRRCIRTWNRKILCVSESVRKNLARQGIYNTETIYLGVPTNAFKEAKPVGFRKELGIDASTPLIITVARFQKIKGQLKAVKTAKMLKEAGDSFCYVFVGGCVFGNADDSEYEQEVIRYAREEGLLEREVRFVGERQDIPGIMKEADLLIIPSDNESLGVVALEAMASRLPIVSTPNDGVGEILQNDRRCIASSNDAEGLFVLAHRHINDVDIREAVVADFARYGYRYDSKVVAGAFVKAISR